MRVKALTFSLFFCFCVDAQAPAQQTWIFDRTDRVAGFATTVLGHPRVIDTPSGKAVEFNGVDDAIYVETHPLAGAETWTWEVIFRPDADGSPEQRFFHLQVSGTDDRMLFETRLADGKWCLDSFAKSGAESLALMDRAKLHPAGAWYHAAAVYDGKEFRNYVDGVLEGRGPLHLAPQGAGRTSVGVRINKVNFFKGAVRAARMTPRALTVSEFLKK